MSNSLRKEEKKLREMAVFGSSRNINISYILTYKLKNLFPYLGYAAIFYFLKVHDIQTPGLTAEERQNRKK